MIHRRLLDTVFVFCLALTPWSASGQVKPTASSTDSASPKFDAGEVNVDRASRFLASAIQQVREWVASESSVQQELRRGLTRLEKGCAQKAAGSKAEPPSPELVAAMTALQDAAAARASRKNALEVPVGLWTAQSSELVRRHCTGVSSFLGLGILKSAACRRAETIDQGVKGLRTELDSYLGATVERYRSYTRLAQLEMQGCVRTGFTGRLIQADEVHLRPAELRQSELLEQWNQELKDLMRLAGEQP